MFDTFPNRYWHKGFLVFGLHSHISTLQASAITKFAERQSKPLIEFQRTGHYLYCILYQLTIAILIIWPIIKCLIIVFSGNDTYTDSDTDYDNGYLNGLTDFFILNHFFNNRKWALKCYGCLNRRNIKRISDNLPTFLLNWNYWYRNLLLILAYNCCCYLWLNTFILNE